MGKTGRLGCDGGGLLSLVCWQLLICIAVTTTTVSAARRHDGLLPANPTPEALRDLAHAMGAAAFSDLAAEAIGDSAGAASRVLKTGLPADTDVEFQSYQGVMGRPGIDFPVLPSIPNTSFNCKNVATGYYADLDTDCQVFHVCDGGRKISFLCPNGTIFHQSHLICDWWFKVDCLDSPSLYEESAEHLAHDQGRGQRASKQSQASAKSYETIQTQKRPQINYGSHIHAGHNHNNEYKAEASFTSVAQSAPRSDSLHNNEHTRENKKPSPQSFRANSRQDRIENSRQYSSFEHSSNESELESQQDEDAQKKQNTNNYAPTRRTISEFTDSAVYRASTPASRNSKETQVVAESASFLTNRGRNGYFQYNNNYENKVRSTAATYSTSYMAPAKTTRPTYATTYVPGSKSYVEVSRSISQKVSSTPPTTTAQVFDKDYSTTNGFVNNVTHEDDVSYSFVQYSQYPTTVVPHNHFQITTNHTKERRTGKAIQNSQPVNKQSYDKDSKSYGTESKSKSNSFYAPTVPTVTPKVLDVSRDTPTHYWYSAPDVVNITTSTPETYTAYPSYVTPEPVASEHAVEMLKTLEELEFGPSEPTVESNKFSGSRPGLIVPPSAGPNTLHSLAIYFATAVDSLGSTVASPTLPTEEDTYEDATEVERIPEENRESFTALLSESTLNKYTDLFKNSSSESNPENSSESEEDVTNDLELSQSRGPLSSSPQIRELAQVFTHALSAYLQDPETFRKVLSEIRPTDPPPTAYPRPIASVTDSTSVNDYSSVTNEEDEVLDFSDVSKISTQTSPRTTEIQYDVTRPIVVADTTRTPYEDEVKNQVVKSTTAYQPQNSISIPKKDRTPASKIITEGLSSLEEDFSARQGKELLTTSIPTTKNAVAIEINGGLSETNNKVPQSFTTQTTTTQDGKIFDADSSYFPDQKSPSLLPRYGGFQNNSSENLSPYGAGVKPSNATPINGIFAESVTEAIPLHWGDIISTRASPAPQVNPSAPSFDLVPPNSNTFQQKNKLDSVEMSVINSFVPEDLNNLATINKTTGPVYSTTTEQPQTQPIYYNENRAESSPNYKPNTSGDLYGNTYGNINDNEEQLQRAHSQSFVSSANQLGRRGKKIRTQTSKDEAADEKASVNNTTLTIKTSTGAIIALPTLKDILLTPTSMIPSQQALVQAEPSIAPTDAPTTTTQNNTVTSTAPAITTTQSVSTSTEYPRSTVKAQGSSSTSNYNIWSTSSALGQIWQTTVFLDPMTINDGLISDSDAETILPSANTYIAKPVTNKWNNNLRSGYSSPVPTTLFTDQTDQGQYSTYTTPLSTTIIEETTTRLPEEITYVYTDSQTFETAPTTQSSLKYKAREEFFSQYKNFKEDEVVTEKPKKNREGKALSQPIPVSPLQRLNATDVDLTMMTKAKEMFGGLNATSANTLMNVMKQADRNTTVRRLILLLVQTCDDDHNKTIEASRTALLDALIRIPVEESTTTVTQNPITENLEVTGQFDSHKTTPPQTTNYYNVRRSDEIFDADDTKRPEILSRSSVSRRGKSFGLEPIVSLSTQATTTTTEPTTTVTETPVFTTSTSTSVSSSTSAAPVVTIRMSRRGNRKFKVKSTKTAISSKQALEKGAYTSSERGTTSSLEDQSVPSDTRALELLRSLYSLAARWG